MGRPPRPPNPRVLCVRLGSSHTPSRVCRRCECEHPGFSVSTPARGCRRGSSCLALPSPPLGPRAALHPCSRTSPLPLSFWCSRGFKNCPQVSEAFTRHVTKNVWDADNHGPLNKNSGYVRDFPVRKSRVRACCSQTCWGSLVVPDENSILKYLKIS